MKKALMIWFVAIFGVVALGCSLAPDTKQILGDWWGTNMDVTMGGMSMETNYLNEADSEMLLKVDETHAYMTSKEDGVVTDVDTNTYVLDEDAGTITTTDTDGSNSTSTYVLDKDILTITDSGVDDTFGAYSMVMTFIRSD